MLKVNAPYNIAVTRKYFLFLLFFLAFGWGTALAAEADPTVAERNAAQGFNDTIDRLAPDFVHVSLVVAEPGGILYSAFGHAMLHLQCPTFNLDYIFTYESEPIRDNWWRFFKGNLRMGMFALDPDSVFIPYREEGRGVKEYTLHLNPLQEQELWRQFDMLAERGADRPYDYYQRGCAISIVNVVNDALHGNKIVYNEWPERFDGTLRELGYRCVTKSGFIWNRFVLMTLAGSGIDGQLTKERKLIVPEDLVEVWQHAQLNGHVLLDSEPHVIVASSKQHIATWCTPFVVSLLFLLFSLVSLLFVGKASDTPRMVSKVFDYVLLIIQTLLGAVVTYTVLFSSLPCTDWNWLIIPFNILPVLAWPWRKYWALPYLVMIVLWCIGMLCAPHRLVESAHILLALAFAVVLLKQSPLWSRWYKRNAV